MNTINRFCFLFLVTVAVVGPKISFGQTAPLAGVQQRLSAYTNQNFQEKIYVHVDRPLYVVGETMWFKVYCVSADTHRPLDVSKVAYLELLDKESNPVAQMKLSLTNGQGDGNLIVPAGLANGTYALRCYTNWMKNFNPGAYFLKRPSEFSIPLSVPENPARCRNWQKTPAYDLQYFPEGGNLVGSGRKPPGFSRHRITMEKALCFKGALVSATGRHFASFRAAAFWAGQFQIHARQRREVPRDLAGYAR